jgi:hypothetical protein
MKGSTPYPGATLTTSSNVENNFSHQAAARRRTIH